MIPFDTARCVGPMPRHWEQALGYTLPEPRRWLLLYATPYGDDLMYSDGVLSATSNWLPFLEVVESSDLVGPLLTVIREQFHRQRLPDLLGSSTHLGTHGVLCDLVDREVYLVELEQVHAFLTPPPPEGYVPPTPEEQASLWHEVQLRLATERQRLEAERRGKQMQLCTTCLGHHGYVLAPDGGFDLCPACQGEPVRWIVPTIPLSPPAHD